MAEGIRLVCDECGNSVKAWSDGNPYYIDGDGEKQYAYHPNHEELAKCTGNDEEMYCLGCGCEFKSDSNDPAVGCPGCSSQEIVSPLSLSTRRCPKCSGGVFRVDRDWHAIS
jgi:DNA-directed RNA polymerase subunit RPC12/RpoP